MKHFNISPAQERAWTNIVEIAPDTFRKLVVAIESAASASVRASILYSQVLEVTANEEAARALCSQVLSLAAYKRMKQLSADEVLSRLIAGFEAQEKFKLILDWAAELRSELESLLQSDAVRLSAKALHLSSDYERIFTSAHVVTELRPIFDGEREDIVGAVVGQTLRIRFFEEQGLNNESELPFALDLDDIGKLIDELKKAKKKAENAKRQFEGEHGLEVFIAGEETYGFG